MISNMSIKKELIKDIIQWDIKSWSKALLYWEKNIDWDKVHNGLELGGREGGLSLWLASKGKQIICSDLKDVKSTAEKLHIYHNVSSLIYYQDIDATNIPYENHFDIIMFKSIIGGIGKNDNLEIQKKVFKEIHKALKPGGKLLFAENLIASSLHQQLRSQFVNWGSSWRYLTVNELDRFLVGFSTVNIHTTGILSALGRNEFQRSFLYYLDEFIFNKICPNNWKYISYGIAVK